ncbi:MAG: hypothetical protein Q8R83_05780 [Legionellaceae bacterium]|nr:hypothetical protein [Legionellaceae bacterium]
MASVRSLDCFVATLLATTALKIVPYRDPRHYQLNYFDFENRSYARIHSCGFFAKYPLGIAGEIVGACAGAVITLSTGIVLTTTALSLVLATLALVLAETILTLFVAAIRCCVVGPDQTAREFGFVMS